MNPGSAIRARAHANRDRDKHRAYSLWADGHKLTEIARQIGVSTTTPTWVGDAHDLHWIGDDTYDLTILDPPYSNEESEILYSTPKLRWTTFISEAVRVTRPGGHVAVYHVKQPPRPSGTRLVRRIVILTRTWHAPRVCFVFEKLSVNGYEHPPETTLFPLD